MTKACPFCNISNDIKKEKGIFYRNESWFAILAAPGHTKGHAILAAVRRSDDCQTEPSLDVLNGLPQALSKTIAALKSNYGTNNILLSSLRGSVPHYHFHLVPLHEHERTAWRNSQNDKEGYKDGHLMEFLGHLEKQSDDRGKKSGLSEEQQRIEIVASQEYSTAIEKLRLVSGYFARCDHR